MPELRRLVARDEELFYSLSFDIDDFIGDGIWWLQVYGSDKQMIYDKPFASSKGCFDNSQIEGMIVQEISNV